MISRLASMNDPRVGTELELSSPPPGVNDTHDQLFATEQFLSAVLGSIRDALIVVDRDGVIQATNAAALAMFGYQDTELEGQPIQQVLALPLTLGDQVSTRLLTLQPEQLAVLHDGARVPVRFNATAVRGRDERIESVICTMVSISRRNDEEAELRHADRLQSVGRLAAGIAHEINTPIQFIGDSVYFLRDAFAQLHILLKSYQTAFAVLYDADPDSPLLQAVRAAEEEADLSYLDTQVPKAFERTVEGVARVATIVRAMKQFAHPNKADKAPADINQALINMLAVARNEYKYVADVETQLGELPLVTCHVSDLNQVFLNLLVNAAHAVADAVEPNGERGRIVVQSYREGDRVVIAVSDTGGGIDDAIRDRIFEPFFTTKDVGRGTGQGLAIARSVVVGKHGGSLTFETAKGRGTTFYVRIPIHGEDDVKEAA